LLARVNAGGGGPCTPLASLASGSAGRRVALCLGEHTSAGIDGGPVDTVQASFGGGAGGVVLVVLVLVGGGEVGGPSGEVGGPSGGAGAGTGGERAASAPTTPWIEPAASAPGRGTRALNEGELLHDADGERFIAALSRAPDRRSWSGVTERRRAVGEPAALAVADTVAVAVVVAGRRGEEAERSKSGAVTPTAHVRWALVEQAELTGSGQALLGLLVVPVTPPAEALAT
jgi:hypothetical protein